MTSPPWTLASLAFHWGDAYLFSYTRDRRVALRRDRRYFITADTLPELEAAISSNYAKHPVPRSFDPPGATDYLGDPDHDPETEDGDAALDVATMIILMELRQPLLAWTITHSADIRAWIERWQKEGPQE